jgi:hypothetical protein
MKLQIKISDWVARFGGTQEAACALGVDRVTLWRWAEKGEYLPEPWVYKALYLTRKPRKTGRIDPAMEDKP